MKVFWVLFLVLLHTIGNQGDPMHGLVNFQADKAPSYLVSVRNRSNCHICTGSMISKSWGLTSIQCQEATHILYDISEFNICDKKGDMEHTRSIRKKQNNTVTALLFKVKNFDNKHRILGLPTIPTSSCCHKRQSDFGNVIGWSFDNSKSIFVMKTSDRVSLNEAFDENNTAFPSTFEQISTGSPLIVNGGFIYGFFRNCTSPFYNICDEEDWIKAEIKEEQNNP